MGLYHIAHCAQAARKVHHNATPGIVHVIHPRAQGQWSELFIKIERRNDALMKLYCIRHVIKVADSFSKLGCNFIVVCFLNAVAFFNST